VRAGQLTAKQHALFERIEREYPNSWFQAKSLGATLTDLDALHDAGYLMRRKPVPQSGMRTYRLKPEWQP